MNRVIRNGGKEVVDAVRRGESKPKAIELGN